MFIPKPFAILFFLYFSFSYHKLLFLVFIIVSIIITELKCFPMLLSFIDAIATSF